MVHSIREQHTQAVAQGPLRPDRAARRQTLRDAAAGVKKHPGGKPRTPGEVDAVLDLLLEHLALDVDH